MKQLLLLMHVSCINNNNNWSQRVATYCARNYPYKFQIISE